MSWSANTVPGNSKVSNSHGYKVPATAFLVASAYEVGGQPKLSQFNPDVYL